ncbi:hypothetical protein B0H16DRAFT_1857432, partial [Mycena metata]
PHHHPHRYILFLPSSLTTLGVQRRPRCAATLAIMCHRIDSGALYSVSVLTYLIVDAIPAVAILTEPLFQMLAQVMGIAPTLIIVRVAGLAFEGPADSKGRRSRPADAKLPPL